MQQPTAPVWFSVGADSEEALLDVLRKRKYKAEGALEKLQLASLTGYPRNTGNFDYVSDFSKYVKIDDVDYCQKLLSSDANPIYPYRMGTVIGAGKMGTVRYLAPVANGQPNFVLAIKAVPTNPTEFLRMYVYDMSQKVPWYSYWDWENSLTKPPQKVLPTIGADGFANQTNIHNILNLVLQGNKNYVRQYDAFYCGKTGYNIMEVSNRGNLHSYLSGLGPTLDNNTMVDVMTQLLSVLSILKQPKYAFNHSDLKAKNVFVREEKGKAYFKVADYDKSSIIYNGFRFFNDTPAEQSIASSFVSGAFSSSTQVAPTIRKEGDKWVYEILSRTSSAAMQLQTMHNPYGVPMSYDVYTLVLSFLGIPNVVQKFWEGNLPVLEAVLKILFPSPGEYFGIIAASLKSGDMSSMGYINAVLNGVKLQYDVSAVYAAAGVTAPALEHTARPVKTEVPTTIGRNICKDPCDTALANTLGFNDYVFSESNKWKACHTNKHVRKGAVVGNDYCPA